MTPIIAELVGTLLLVFLGNCVVANVLLTQSKGNNAGWLVITFGYSSAVVIAIYATNAASGAHLNPAVTLALALIGKFPWAQVPGYIAAQTVGAALSAVLTWLAYFPHWKVTRDPATKLGVFCTAPAIRHAPSNFFVEVIGTAVLMFGILAIQSPKNLVPGSGFDTGFGPMLVGLVVFNIGLCLGGPTGFAINPARDLGPRLAHAVLPIHGKGGSDWPYAWIPILGPIAGAIAGACIHQMLG